MAKSMTFVTGNHPDYDLCAREQEELINSLKSSGIVKLADGVYWVPDLDLVEEKVHSITATRGK